MRGGGPRGFMLAIVCACAVAVPRPARAASTLIEAHPPAPGFRIESLTHDRLDLAELLRHGPVLLDFWATWCKPCTASLPGLESLHRRYGARGLTVIGVSIDGPRNFSKLRPFVTRLALTFPIALDEDGSLQQRYQVRAAPTTFLIDRDGHVALMRVGYTNGDDEAFERAVLALLPALTDSSNAAAAPGASPSK